MCIQLTCCIGGRINLFFYIFSFEWDNWFSPRIRVNRNLSDLAAVINYCAFLKYPAQVSHGTVNNLLVRNCSIRKMLTGSFSFGGAYAANTVSADSNSFPPFPPWTSTARPKAVDRITSIVILLYSLKEDRTRHM